MLLDTHSPSRGRSSTRGKRPRSAGLIYVSDEEPGIRRTQGRQGLHLPRAERRARSRTRRRWSASASSPSRRPGRTSGSARKAERPHPGDRARRQGPQAVPLPPGFREVRESTKYEHMMEFARALPAIRAKLAEHMALRGLPREKVLATVVHLLETTLIRVGNDEYAKQNKSYGLTTLRDRHVEGRGRRAALPVQGQERQDLAPAGQGPAHRQDREGLPGPARPEPVPVPRRGRRARDVTSADVNAYLQGDHRPRHHGQGLPHLGRHGAGRAGAAGVRDLRHEAKAKKNIRAAIERVAARLGNTPTICRKCYIHPEVLNSYLDGALLLEIKERGRDRAAREPRRPEAGGGRGAHVARGPDRPRTREGRRRGAGRRRGSPARRRRRSRRGREGAHPPPSAAEGQPAEGRQGEGPCGV